MIYIAYSWPCQDATIIITAPSGGIMIGAAGITISPAVSYADVLERTRNTSAHTVPRVVTTTDRQRLKLHALNTACTVIRKPTLPALISPATVVRRTVCTPYTHLLLRLFVRQVVCSGKGACNNATGGCTCYPGFYGGDCSLIRCPTSKVLRKLMSSR